MIINCIRCKWSAHQFQLFEQPSWWPRHIQVSTITVIELFVYPFFLFIPLSLYLGFYPFPIIFYIIGKKKIFEIVIWVLSPCQSQHAQHYCSKIVIVNLNKMLPITAWLTPVLFVVTFQNGWHDFPPLKTGKQTQLYFTVCFVRRVVACLLICDLK